MYAKFLLQEKFLNSYKKYANWNTWKLITEKNLTVRNDTNYYILVIYFINMAHLPF